MRPFLIGGHPIKAGDIGPGNLFLYPVQKRLPGEVPLQENRRVKEIGKKGFAFTDQKQIEEVGERFGVQRDGDAAADDERMSLRSLRRGKGIPALSRILRTLG